MKKMRILIITLIVILVLGCATFAALYFATDIFKSNKEIFCKYIAQMKLAELDDDNRLKNETNSSKGIFSFRLEAEGETIDEGFEYSSESDPANKLGSSKISIKQDGENKLTVDYLRNEDLYGLRFEDIINQYIVVENNNLKEFAEKLRLEREIIEAIPDKIEIKDSEFINQEELKQIYSKYINVALEQTSNENYSKVGKESITVGTETIEADGYMLSINSADLKRILIAMLNTAENDEQIFNLISKINQEESNQITFEEYKETIEMIRDELLEEEIEENSLNLNITVYKQGKNVVKVYTRISVPDEEKSYIDFSIDKVKDDEIELKANIVMDEATLSINFSKNGNSNSKNIGINALVELKASEEGSIKIEYSNNTEFGTNVDIEKFDSKNHAVINNFEGEQISNLVVNLSNKIYEKIDREKTIFGLMSTMNRGLFDKAEQATNNTKAAMIYEAIALTKAEFIEALDGYPIDSVAEIVAQIQEQGVKEEIEGYLNGIEVNVTRTPGTQEYIITVDGMELDEDKSKIDFSDIMNMSNN